MTAFMPIKEEMISSKEYIELSKKEPHEIKKAQFVPPKLGQSGYGEFKVLYKTAKLKKLILEIINY
tara:strand:- start:8214 stop:8411 length:198 start_codon:yes stop_codon:yes gene_type:complete